MQEQLNLIKDHNIRVFVEEFLQEEVPEYFFTMPSSTTGKYHPKYTLGEGGLVRHTKAAVTIAYELFEIISFSEVEKDIIIASLILHDTFKCGDRDTHTKHEHPEIASMHIQKFGTLDKGVRNQISNAVKRHMGKWNTSKYSSIVLSIPETKLQRFVHMCDYLASRKCIEVELC